MKYVTVEWGFAGQITQPALESAKHNFDEVVVDEGGITFIDYDTEQNHEHGGGSNKVADFAEKFNLKCVAEKVLSTWQG